MKNNLMNGLVESDEPGELCVPREQTLTVSKLERLEVSTGDVLFVGVSTNGEAPMEAIERLGKIRDMISKELPEIRLLVYPIEQIKFSVGNMDSITDYPSLEWTGDNKSEIEEFVLHFMGGSCESGVGSNVAETFHSTVDSLENFHFQVGDPVRYSLELEKGESIVWMDNYKKFGKSILKKRVDKREKGC